MNKWENYVFLFWWWDYIQTIQHERCIYVPMQQDWGLSNTQIGLALLFMPLFKQSDYFHHCIITSTSLRKFYYQRA